MRSVPYEANFADLSSNSPTEWDWNFGDGGTSTEQHPVYQYNAEGTYTVTLTAASAAGSDVLIRTDYISVPEPVGTLQLLSGYLGLLVLNAHRRASRRESRRA